MKLELDEVGKRYGGKLWALRNFSLTVGPGVLGLLGRPANHAGLALGVWSGTSKPFEVLYTVWWYVGPLHRMRALDFTGMR